MLPGAGPARSEAGSRGHGPGLVLAACTGRGRQGRRQERHVSCEQLKITGPAAGRGEARLWGPGTGERRQQNPCAWARTQLFSSLPPTCPPSPAPAPPSSAHSPSLPHPASACLSLPVPFAGALWDLGGTVGKLPPLPPGLPHQLLPGAGRQKPRASGSPGEGCAPPVVVEPALRAGVPEDAHGRWDLLPSGPRATESEGASGLQGRGLPPGLRAIA